MFGRTKDIEERFQELEARIGQLDALLDRIDDRIRTILRGEDGLATRAEVREMGSRVDELSTAVAHGIENVERRENRIKSTVGRALKVLEEHGFDPSPGLEAEARGLQLIDAGGSEPERVQPVPDDVDPYQVARASLEGIPGEHGPEDLETMRRRLG